MNIGDQVIIFVDTTIGDDAEIFNGKTGEIIGYSVEDGYEVKFDNVLINTGCQCGSDDIETAHFMPHELTAYEADEPYTRADAEADLANAAYWDHVAQEREHDIALREGGYYLCFPEKDNRP